MTRSYDPKKQFELTPGEFLAKLDLLNWYRYYRITKALSQLEPKSILEVGPGEGTVTRVYGPFVERYETMDVNEKLSPTYRGDVRTPRPELAGRYDAVIAADILEHIPFSNLEGALRNLHSYLAPGGHALITIPHRACFIFLVTWRWGYRPFLLRAPDWLRIAAHRIVKRKDPPIDPDHQWEIGDGHHAARDVEGIIKKAGFSIERCEKLPYVDFWVLKK